VLQSGLGLADRSMGLPNWLTILAHPADPGLRDPARYRGRGWRCFVFCLASLTDMLDGYIARSQGRQTTARRLPRSDGRQLLLTSGFVTLTWLKVIPFWITAVVVSRDVVLSIGVLVHPRGGRHGASGADLDRQDVHRVQMLTVLAAMAAVYFPAPAPIPSPRSWPGSLPRSRSPRAASTSSRAQAARDAHLGGRARLECPPAGREKEGVVVAAVTPRTAGGPRRPAPRRPHPRHQRGRPARRDRFPLPRGRGASAPLDSSGRGRRGPRGCAAAPRGSACSSRPRAPRDRHLRQQVCVLLHPQLPKGMRKSLYVKDDDFRLSFLQRQLHHADGSGGGRAGAHRGAAPVRRSTSRCTPPTRSSATPSWGGAGAP